MTTHPFATVDSLRQGIAEAITISVKEMQESIGPMVVTTSGECTGVVPEQRSLYDPASRTLVLLADRVLAGQEAKAAAEEVLLWHGEDAVQALFGQGHDGLASDGNLAERILFAKFIRSDGTLRGVTLGRAQGKRGPCLQIALPKLGLNKSLGIEGRDFHELYAQAVALVADAKEVHVDTPTYRFMLKTKAAFLKVNGVELEAVAYVQAKTANMGAGLSAAKGGRDSDFDSHGIVSSSIDEVSSHINRGWPATFGDGVVCQNQAELDAYLTGKASIEHGSQLDSKICFAIGELSRDQLEDAAADANIEFGEWTSSDDLRAELIEAARVEQERQIAPVLTLSEPLEQSAISSSLTQALPGGSEYEKGYKDALESIALALAPKVAEVTLDEALTTALDAYANNVDHDLDDQITADASFSPMA